MANLNNNLTANLPLLTIKELLPTNNKLPILHQHNPPMANSPLDTGRQLQAASSTASNQQPDTQARHHPHLSMVNTLVPRVESIEILL
jgi:hypothetical protein